MKNKENKRTEFRVGFFCALGIVGAIAAALLLILNLP